MCVTAATWYHCRQRGTYRCPATIFPRIELPLRLSSPSTSVSCRPISAPCSHPMHHHACIPSLHSIPNTPAFAFILCRTPAHALDEPAAAGSPQTLNPTIESTPSSRGRSCHCRSSGNASPCLNPQPSAAAAAMTTALRLRVRLTCSTCAAEPMFTGGPHSGRARHAAPPPRGRNASFHTAARLSSYRNATALRKSTT